MHKLFLISFCFWISTSSLVAQEWMYDLNAAKIIATKSEKNILLVFSGSDWCGPCKKLDQDVWQTSEFTSYAEEHFVLVKADFPRKKANRLSEYQQSKNNELAGRYNQEGFFPLVVVMAKDGKVLGKTGYKTIGASAYIEHLNSFKKF